MTYLIRGCWIDNIGELHERKRLLRYDSPARLRIGGLYFLAPGKLYRVVKLLPEGTSVEREG